MTGVLPADMSFSEISGIRADLDVEEYREGGSNDTAFFVPTRVAYSNLVCRRGLAPFGSALLSWCFDTFAGKDNRFTVKNIVVALMNRDPSPRPYMTWTFYGALPVSWEVSEFNAMKSDVAIEKIEFKYRRMSYVSYPPANP
jgi:phage tail-like protein